MNKSDHRKARTRLAAELKPVDLRLQAKTEEKIVVLKQSSKIILAQRVTYKKG